MTKTATHRLRAHNFAQHSDNRIHSDEVARQYGFSGGLVPGVASYAYLVRPTLELLGDEWLSHGTIEVKLIHPVYDGDDVVAEATGEVSPTGERGETGGTRSVALQLRDSQGKVCAVGTATIGTASAESATLTAGGPFERVAPPPRDRRPPASLDVLQPPTALVSLEARAAILHDGQTARGLNAPTYAEFRQVLAERYVDDDPRFLVVDGPLHPALIPDLANQVLARTVKLGPWIHARCATTHFAPLPKYGLEARGRVVEVFEKNGHEIADIDVRLYDPREALVARVLHRAIIKPAKRG